MVGYVTENIRVVGLAALSCAVVLKLLFDFFQGRLAVTESGVAYMGFGPRMLGGYGR